MFNVLKFRRISEASGSHPLAQALLFRMRLDAVRRMAAVDGALIDPWHLARHALSRAPPPLSPIERRAFDYTALEEAMANLEAVFL